MIKRICSWLNRSPYEKGKVKFLLARDSLPSLLEVEGVPFDFVKRILTIICASFGVPESQMYCLRLEDNLADIYKTFVEASLLGMSDNLEYERLYLELEDMIGKFNPKDLSPDINITVLMVIKFAFRKHNPTKP
jgi:hypothetical protein